MIGIFDCYGPALTDTAQTAVVRRDAQWRALTLDPLRTVVVNVSFRPGETVAALASPTQTRVDVDLPAVSTHTPIDTAVTQLLSFKGLGADWDGNHAAAPAPSSIEGARTFIRSLSPDSQIPQLTLHANGNVLLFVNETDRYAEIEFLDEKHIGFFASRGDREWSDEILFNGRSLPEGLSEIGFTI